MYGAIMPIGIIEEGSPEGGVFMLLRPEDRSELHEGAPVTVWNHQNGVTVKFRGEVTEIGPTKASFRVTGSELNPKWPERVNPVGTGMGVYLAEKPGSFEPDLSRVVRSGEESRMLMDFGRMHEEETGMESYAAVAAAAMLERPANGGPRE